MAGAGEVTCTRSLCEFPTWILEASHLCSYWTDISNEAQGSLVDTVLVLSSIHLTLIPCCRSLHQLPCP